MQKALSFALSVIAGLFFVSQAFGQPKSTPPSNSPTAAPTATPTPKSGKICCVCGYGSDDNGWFREYIVKPINGGGIDFPANCDKWLADDFNKVCDYKAKISAGDFFQGKGKDYCAPGVGSPPSDCTAFRYRYEGHGDPSYMAVFPDLIGSMQRVAPNCTLYRFSSSACSLFGDRNLCVAGARKVGSKLPPGCRVECLGNQIVNGNGCTTAPTIIGYEIVGKGGSCDVTALYHECYQAGTPCFGGQKGESWQCYVGGKLPPVSQQCCECKKWQGGILGSMDYWTTWGTPGKGCNGACEIPTPTPTPAPRASATAQR